MQFYGNNPISPPQVLPYQGVNRPHPFVENICHAFKNPLNYTVGV